MADPSRSKKVEISRIDPGHQPSRVGAPRTSRACNACRKARAKCTGGEPCKRCDELEVECIYGEFKREADRRFTNTLTEENRELLQKNQHYLDLLKRIGSSGVLSDVDRNVIEEILAQEGVGHPESSVSQQAATGSYPGQHPGSDLQKTSRALDFESSTGTPSSVSRSPASQVETATDVAARRAHLGLPGAFKEIVQSKNYQVSAAGQLSSQTVSEQIRPIRYADVAKLPAEPQSGTAAGMDLEGPLDVPLGEASQISGSSRIPWTSVTSNHELVEHLLALYFCWEYPTFASLSREHFMADFTSGNERYCSSLLVNAILALGSRFSDMPEARKDASNPDTAGEHFFDECKRLWAEVETPSLTAAQALGLMSLRQASRGNDGSSLFYARLSMRMALDMELQLDREIYGLSGVRFSRDDLEVRRATFWGCFNLEQAWCLCIQHQPQGTREVVQIGKPFIKLEVEDEEWVPYTDDRRPLGQDASQRSQIRTVYETFSGLSEIIHDTLITLLSNKNNSGFTDVIAAYTRYLEWYGTLSDHLRLGYNYTPTVLFTHMYYHFAIILLFRPFLVVGFPSSTINPRQICIQSAESLGSLIQTYRRLYTLRRTPSFVPYMILTSSIIFLAAIGLHRLDPNSMEIDPPNYDWLAYLDELSVPHGFARRSIRILRHFARVWNVPDPSDGGSQIPSPGGPLTPDLTFFKPGDDIDLVDPRARTDRPANSEFNSPPSPLNRILLSLFPAQGLPQLGSPDTHG